MIQISDTAQTHFRKLIEREALPGLGVRWLVEHEINPQLAEHRGNVSLQEITADGVVVLRFGGGCHGCGMADVTLKQGIEKTLIEKAPGVTAVRDATDHATGDAPYIPRDTAA